MKFTMIGLKNTDTAKPKVCRPFWRATLSGETT